MADAIPEGWSQVLFGDVVNLSKTKTKDPIDNGIERFIGLEHIEAYDLKVRTWGNTADGTTFTNLCTPGQILFGKRRPYLRKLAVADFPAVCSGDIYIFEPLNEAIDRDYLTYLCFSDSFFEYAIQTSAGSLSPRTNWKHLSKYEFVLPPVDVQKRIVKVIESINDHLNALEVLHETTKSLERSLSSRLMSQKEEKYRQSSFKDEVEIVVGTAFKSKIYRKCEIGIPLVRGKNIGPDGFRWDEVFHWPNNLLEGFEKNLLDTGNILIPMDATFTSVGMIKAAMVREDDLPLLLNQRVASLSPGPNLTNDYLWTLIHSQAFADHLKSSQTGSFAPHISKDQIEKFVFQLPKISRQKEIYSEINSVNSLRTNLKFQIEKVLELRKTLISDLLCGSLQIADDFEVPT